jgi:DNA-binding CsgD family transcriptional regulator/PAS domain-containing protein
MARRPRSPEQRLTLALERVYQVSFGEATWESALTAVSDFLGAECADLTFTDPVRQYATRWEHARLDPRTVEEYTKVYMAANWTEVHPRVPVGLKMREGQVVADIDFWDASQRKRMMFFEEYYHALVRCGECVMGCVRKTADEPWVYLTPHFRSREPRPRKTREHLQMLLPHIRRAVDIESRLDRLHKEKKVLAEALDHVTQAVALLDRSGRVVQVNRAAEAIFRGGDGVATAADGRVVLATSDARASLVSALAQCVTPLLWTPGAGVMPSTQIMVRRSRGRPLVLTLQPLPKEHAGAFNAVALLFVSDPDARTEDRGALLRKAYRLSGGEAQLVQALAGGETLKEYAARNDVSYETVRSQLRRVFEKTGVRRQAELVPLVLRAK